MLRKATELKGWSIHAEDADIGHVDQFFFDDEHWVIRYLVVDTGQWLTGRQVLISPIAIGHADLPSGKLNVTLTKEQVKNSPDIDTQRPVSRQQEIEYHKYYGWPYYWGGSGIWGASFYPGSLMAAPAMVQPQGPPSNKESGDPHLRSTGEVIGYHIGATDGPIGHVEDFLIDDESWAIRYVVMDTRNWWPGKKVLVAPQWIENVSWDDSRVYVKLPRNTIQNAPEYDASAPIDRNYELRLHDYYGRPYYWEKEKEVIRK